MDRLLKLFSAKEANYLFACTLVVFLAAFLRFYKLGDPSMWLDEALFAVPTRLDNYADFFNAFSINASPMLWPTLQWMFFGGSQDAWSFRLISAVSGICTVVFVLLLPFCGISRISSFFAGIWIATSPSLVEYSQEAREYNLGVLLATIVIFTFAYLSRKPDSKVANFAFCVFVFLSPLTSYGSVLVVASILGVYTICNLLNKKHQFRQVFLPCACFLCGLVLTFILTARHQYLYVDDKGEWIGTSYWFLQRYYPPENFGDKIDWLKVSLKDYIAFAWGSGRTVDLVGAALLIYIILLPKKSLLKNLEGKLVLTTGFLIAGSLGLAFLEKFPFGGLRYHISSIPLLIIVSCQALAFLKRKLSLGVYSFSFLFAIIVLYGNVVSLPIVYSEVQDIRSAIGSLPQEVVDEQVFIYHNARAAVDFHYPDRNFNRTEGSYISDFLKYVQSNHKDEYCLVFSDSLSPEELTQIEDGVQSIRKYGYLASEYGKFRGVRVFLIEKNQ